MQNIVESGNTNACDGKTSHEISTRYSKLSRDVRIRLSQLQFLKKILTLKSNLTLKRDVTCCLTHIKFVNDF